MAFSEQDTLCHSSQGKIPCDGLASPLDEYSDLAGHLRSFKIQTVASLSPCLLPSPISSLPQNESLPPLSSLTTFFFFFFLTFTFIYLTAPGLSCGIFLLATWKLLVGNIWDLVSRPGIEPRPTAWEPKSQPLDHQEISVTAHFISFYPCSASLLLSLQFLGPPPKTTSPKSMSQDLHWQGRGELKQSEGKALGPGRWVGKNRTPK